MARFPRNKLKTSFFHVMTQGINKSYIFDIPKDIKYYISTMYKLKKEHKIKIIAYCIMNNHTHMLIESKEIQELSKYMQRLNTKYAKYYNDKYERVGYVFRDRYKSEGIYSEKQLYSCIKYIYDNPVKAHICTKASEYPYSNYHKINVELTDDYEFMDVDKNIEDICNNVIKSFLQNNNIDLIDLENNKIKLNELITLLKENYNISFRKMAKELNLNREKIRRIYMNSVTKDEALENTRF